MDKIKKALRILISGESSAVAMYDNFASKAFDDGFPNVGYLFKALAAAEQIHIKNHYNALGEDFTPEIDSNYANGSTADNLQTAIIGEMEENQKIYPSFIKSIKNESKTIYGKVAKLSMSWARDVEKEHANLLKKALKAVNSGEDIDITVIYICQVCGNVIINELTDDPCEICGHDVEFFNKHERSL